MGTIFHNNHLSVRLKKVMHHLWAIRPTKDSVGIIGEHISSGCVKLTWQANYACNPRVSLSSLHQLASYLNECRLATSTASVAGATTHGKAPHRCCATTTTLQIASSKFLPPPAKSGRWKAWARWLQKPPTQQTIKKFLATANQNLSCTSELKHPLWSD